MYANLDKLGGLVFSQRVMLALTQKDISREEAYALVQKYAMQVWKEGGSFLELLKTDQQVVDALGEEELEEMFDLAHHTKHVDTIFQRVFEDA